jgi:hypothetical protein
MQDLKFSDDVQIVFEVALLRMSQAPNMTDLKALLSEGGAVSEGSRPKLTEERAPQQNSATKKSVPSLDKPVFTAPQSVQGGSSAETKPVAKAPLVLKDMSNEDWLVFVQNLKAKDAFFGAQIENLLFLGCTGFKITLQPAQKFAFLTVQLQTAEMRQKLQGLIDSEIAQGYTFEVLKSSAQASGESASTLANKKVVLAEEKLMEKWQSDPRIQKAKEVFKGEIKVIKRSE